MELDRTFASELRKAANGDGGREYRFAFANELKEISAELGKRYEFDDCVKKHGRAKVALCVASTIIYDSCRHETPEIMWARAVLELWTNKLPGRSESAATVNIHPCILADNSYSLRKLTTVT